MESGAFNGSYDFSSRFKGGSGTNPEEFDAAPHAGCFSMALATRAHQRRTPAEPRHDDRESHIEKKKGAFAISLIKLETEGDVPGIDDQTPAAGTTAKNGCQVSKALAGLGKSDSSAPAWLQAKRLPIARSPSGLCVASVLESDVIRIGPLERGRFKPSALTSVSILPCALDGVADGANDEEAETEQSKPMLKAKSHSGAFQTRGGFASRSATHCHYDQNGISSSNSGGGPEVSVRPPARPPGELIGS